MTLLAPWALWFFAVAGGVLALYLLKIRRRRELVPALDFWRRLASRTQVRSLFQRLKRWLSLFLWLLIVACLVIALGNPVITFGRVKPASIAVVIDNSASMQAVEEDGRTRLEAAIDAVREMTSRRPVPDEWLLIEAGREPRVRQAWTRDRKSVQEAAAATPLSWASGDLGAAVDLARQLLEGKERPHLVVLSDGASGEVGEFDTDERLVYWPIGETDDNLGITRLSVRHHRERALHYAYLQVVNASKEEIETQVVLEIDGITQAVEPMTIAPGGAWENTVQLEAPEGGVLHAWIDRDDVLAVDDEAYAILEPIEPATILLVSPREQAFFFEQSLAAMDPLVSVEESLSITIDEYETHVDSVESFDLVVFNNAAPAELPAAGRFVFVNEWSEGVPAKIVGSIRAPAMSITERDHPLTRYLSLRAARLAGAHRVMLPRGARVLAESASGEPLIFVCREPNREMLCLAFDVLQSDLPFRNAFPLLLRNAVVWMSEEQTRWVEREHRIGEVIAPIRSLPDDLGEVVVARLEDEQITESALAVTGGSFSFRDTESAGPLRFAIGDEHAYTVINLADPHESRLAPITSEVDPAERLALSGRLLGTMPWLALVALACLLVTLEWLTYHRRWTE